MIYLRVEDLRDLKLRFSVYFNRRWRRLYVIRNGVWNRGFQLEDMEDWVYGLHGVRESEGEGVGTCLCNDTIWL